MSEGHRQRAPTWLRSVSIGLVCLAVGIASYVGGQYLLLHRMHEAAPNQPSVAPTPPSAVELPPPPSPTRVTILPKKPVEQKAPEKEKDGKALEGQEERGVAYAIQVGSFSTPQAAEQLAKELAGKGHPAAVVKSGDGDHVTYAVRVGYHGQRASAEKALGELQRDYPGAFLKAVEAPRG